MNAGVPLAVIRKRLGHARIDITLLYADGADEVSDATVREWRLGRL